MSSPHKDHAFNLLRMDIDSFICKFLGVVPTGMVETPKRFIKSWDKMLEGYTADEDDKILKVFDDITLLKDQIVIVKNVTFTSICEHHLLPFFGVAHIGYLPDKKVVGASKLARVFDKYARRFQVQERISRQVVNAIQQCLSPLGAICVVKAQHLCMTARGIEKSEVEMVTSAQTGCFEKQEVKMEFMELLKV